MLFQIWQQIMKQMNALCLTCISLKLKRYIRENKINLAVFISSVSFLYSFVSLWQYFHNVSHHLWECDTFL